MTRRFMRIGCTLLAVASFGGLLVMVLTGLERVHAGHGLLTYRATWLLEFNWVAFLVLSVVMIAAISVAAFLRYREWQEMKR